MENEIKKERITWVRPQDLTLDNARTEYCKMIDLFLGENRAAIEIAAVNKELKAQIEKLKAQIEKITSPPTGGS